MKEKFLDTSQLARTYNVLEHNEMRGCLNASVLQSVPPLSVRWNWERERERESIANRNSDSSSGFERRPLFWRAFFPASERVKSFSSKVARLDNCPLSRSDPIRNRNPFHPLSDHFLVLVRQTTKRDGDGVLLEQQKQFHSSCWSELKSREFHEEF